jgi:hypothetical protein
MNLSVLGGFSRPESFFGEIFSPLCPHSAGKNLNGGKLNKSNQTP